MAGPAPGGRDGLEGPGRVMTWINGRRGTRLDVRDRGLQYGDGLFETMRVRSGAVRLLDHHLARLQAGCALLGIDGPPPRALRRELERRARGTEEAVLKLILTRGVGARGYRPSGEERTTRVISLHPLPPLPGARAVGVRLCATRLGTNPALAGLKTLNRLESVLARGEWRDHRIWEGLLCDEAGHVVCGTQSNLFVRRGRLLLTPRLDRCGIAGVMRRWVLEIAPDLGLEPRETRLRWPDLGRAEEVFMTNAVAGVVSVARLRTDRTLFVPPSRSSAARLRAELEKL